MKEEYVIVLEDGSDIEISNLIWNMYECCSKGDVALANSVVENAIKAEELMKQGNIQKMNVIQSGEDGDDEKDDCRKVGSEHRSQCHFDLQLLTLAKKVRKNKVFLKSRRKIIFLRSSMRN